MVKRNLICALLKYSSLNTLLSLSTGLIWLFMHSLNELWTKNFQSLSLKILRPFTKNSEFCLKILGFWATLPGVPKWKFADGKYVIRFQNAFVFFRLLTDRMLRRRFDKTRTIISARNPDFRCYSQNVSAMTKNFQRTTRR